MGLGSILAMAGGFGVLGSQLTAAAAEPACSSSAPNPAGGCLFAGLNGPTASFAGFEVDGNTVSNGNLDWQSSSVRTSANYTPFYDLFNSTSDDIMSNGSKESDQSTWSCVDSKPPGKSDLGGSNYSATTPTGDTGGDPGTTAGQFAPSGSKSWAGSIWFENTDPGKSDNVQLLFGNFQRFAVNGDVHLDYEFNRSSTTFDCGAGVSMPVRSQGDVLITFDTNNGGASIFVSAFIFNCNGTVTKGNPCPSGGSFVQDTTNLVNGSTFDGTANISPALSDNGVTAGAFGEAGLDLTHTIGAFACQQGATVFMKTRSAGTSDIANGKAEVKDITAPVPFNPGLCPSSSLSKAQKDVTQNDANYNQDCSTTTPTGDANPFCAVGASTTPETVFAGDTIQYKVTYTNNGGGTATAPVVTDAIPTGTTYVASSQSCPTGATCVAADASSFNSAHPCQSTAGTGTITMLVWCLPAEASGASVDLTFQVTIPTSQTTSGDVLFENFAVVNDVNESAADSNYVAVTAHFQPSSSLTKKEADVQSVSLQCNAATLGSVTSTSSCITLPGALTPIASASFVSGPISAAAGDTIAYQLVYHNGGNSNATSVTVTDSIPTGSTYVASSCSNSCTTTTSGSVVTKLTWSLGTVSPGAANDVTLTFEVKLNSVFPAWDGTGTVPAANKVTNVGGVTSTDEQTNIPSNSVEADVSATASPGMIKTASATFTDGTGATCPVGKTCVTWTISYFNTGTGSLAGQVISDTLPAGVTFFSCTTGASPTCTSHTSNSVSWTVDIPAGTSSSSPAGSVTVTVSF